MRLIAILLLTALAAAPSAAESPRRLDTGQEWILAGTGAALFAGGLLLATGVEPYTLDELSRLDLNDVNSFDRSGVHPYRDEDAADILTASSYLLPLTFFATEATREEWRTLAVMWTEAALLNLGLNSVVKATVLRARPYAYDPNAPLDKRTARSARFSFYSGHTTGAAMNCFFVASVFSGYLKDGRARAVVWAGAVTIPALVSFGRVDSGHHFRTDVMTGYAVGAAIGWLIPVMHRHEPQRFSVSPATVLGSAGVAITMRY